MVAIGVMLGAFLVSFPLVILAYAIIQKFVVHDTRPFKDILMEVL